MNQVQYEIMRLLESLDDWNDYVSPGATQDHLDFFTKEAIARGVPAEVTAQLRDLYAVCDECSYEQVMAFHACNDLILFEWWPYGQLWLGQRDCDTLRWSRSSGKFSLGDASNESNGPEFKSNTLVGLIRLCVKDIESIGQDV